MENQSQNTSAPDYGSSRTNQVPAAFDVPQASNNTSVNADFSPAPSLASLGSSQPNPPATELSRSRPPRGRRQKWLAAGMTLFALAAAGTGFIMWRNASQSQQPSLASAQSSDATGRFNTLSIPLDQLNNAGSIFADNSKTLSINGQLKVNNGFVIAPTSQPTNAVAGQIYYDQGSNQLNYYNGASFVPLINNQTSVTSINNTSGALTLGGGLTLNGSQLGNNGVLTVQGQAGNVTFTAGPGVSINGTTISSSGVASLDGASGAITVGPGLNVTNNQLKNTGIISVASSSTSLVVTNDGNGNITLSSNGAGTGTVQSPGGTTNKIAKFTGVQTIADSLLSDDGTTVTVGGNLTVSGTIALSAPLPVTSGGTGSATASGARTNLGAAASGANSDITSLSGLTTALSVSQGGTGVGVLATNGVLVGNGTSAINSVVDGSSGDCLISTTGAPTWQACPGGGGVLSLNGLTGTLTIANATAAGSTITVQDASTLQKGLAEFNGTNFTVSGGIVNTIQAIDTAASPTFASINTNSINPSGPLTVGAVAQSLTLQGTSTTITSASGANTTTLSFVAPTANVTYRLQTAAAGTYDVCTTAGNCAGVGGGVTTAGGTTNQLAKFTNSQAIGNSLISDNGTLVTVGGNLTVTGTTTLSTPLAVASGGTGAATATGARTNLGAAASGANSDITSLSGLTTALSVVQGGTGATSLTTNGVLLGNGTGAISSLAAVSSNECLVSTAGAPVWQTCPGSGGVTSVDGLTGVITIANTSGAGSTITINDASTSQKGIAQFNGTNFSASGGVVNTVQDIAPSATPTFGRLTVTSSQASNGMLLVNNTNISGTGNLIDLQLNGASEFAVSPAGALTLNSTINGQTISSSANFTGTLNVVGSSTLNGATVTGTLTANTITPSSSLTVGSTTQSFVVQGNASSTITATSGTSTTTLAFQTPTASVTYRLLTAAAGTYDICTTVGNCAGVGGGVTTAGGTANTLAKFTGSGSIGNSIITDNGTTVTIGGTLGVNTITPTAAMTIGTTTQNLTLQGATTQLTATSGAVTNTLAFAAPGTSNKTITIPNATGTVAVSASGPLSIDANGNISCPSCVTSGGSSGGTAAVDSVDGLTGALTLANSTGSGTTVTINDASTSQKGIAQFNGTNFSASGGVINTIQDITTASTPTFGQLTLSSSQASATMLTVNNTNALGTGNLIDLQLNGGSKFNVAANGNTTIAGTLTSGTINGQTISSSANFTGSVTVGSSLTVNTITPTGAMTVGATGQSLALQGNAGSTFTATGSGFTTTLGFSGTPTGAVTYNLDRTATAGTYTLCSTAGNCAGVGGGVTTAGGTANTLAKFTAGQVLGNSGITDDGTTVTIGENLSVAANKSLTLANGTGTVTQTYSASTGSASTIAATDTASSGTTTVRGQTINLTGTNNTTGSNAVTGISMGNVTAATNNSFYGISFGTGFTDILRYNNTQLISGTGLLQNTAIDSTLTYSNLQKVGALNIGSIASGFGTIATSNTITGTTLNGTAGINTGAGAGTQRIDSSGNLLNIGTITSGLINGQTISSSANFTGSVTVATSLNANTITPSAALTVGATSQSFTLQGNAGSTITATGGGFTTTVGFSGTPVGAVTYNLDRSAAAGTYTLCSTVGNCAGVGGGVTTGGGTTNSIPKFLSSNSLGNSGLSDDGTNISTTEHIIQTFNTISGTGTTVNLTDSSTSGASTVQGIGINITGTATTGTNTVAGVTFGNVTAASNNTYNGISFGTGFNSLLSYNGTTIVSGGGLIQNAAIDSTLTYTNLQKVGALNVGSIASGFGAISTTNNISTTAAIQGGTGSFTGTNSLTLGAASTATGSILFQGSGSANTLTLIGPSAPSTNTITLPNETGTVCTNASIGTSTVCTLQTAYNHSTGGSSTTPTITLAGTIGGLNIQDADGSTVGGNFLSLRASNGGNTGVQGAVVFGFGMQGQFFEKPTTDTATAMQVENSGGFTLFDIDTSSKYVNIGSTGGTTGGTGSAYNGSTTNIENSPNANTTTIIGSTVQNSGSSTIDIGYTNTSGGFSTVNIGSGTTATGGTTLIRGNGVTITAGAASTWSTSAGALTLQSAAAATWSTTAGILTLQGAAGTSIATPGSSSAATNNITIQSGTTTGVGFASGNITVDAGAPGSGGTAGQVQIGTTNASGVTIGRTNSATTTTIQGGTGNTAISLTTGTGGSINLTAGSQIIGKVTSDSTTAMQLQTSGGAPVLNVNTVNQNVTLNSANGIALNMNVTTATAENGILYKNNGSAVGEIGFAGSSGQIINQTTANDLALKSASGRILLAAGGNDNSFILSTTGQLTAKNTTDSTSAFQIQNSSSATLFNVDTSNERVTVGPSSGDTVGAILVLGNKTNAGDPTGVAGAMYYSSSSNAMRCYADGTWSNCSDPTRLSHGFNIQEEFLGDNTANNGVSCGLTNAVTSDYSWSCGQSGTGAGEGDTTTDSAQRPGQIQMATGTTATGVASIYLGGSTTPNFFIGGGETFETAVKIPTLSNGTQTYVLHAGLCDVNFQGGDCNNGVYFEYSSATSANWRIDTAAGGTRTKTTTTKAVATGWTDLKFVALSSTSIEFYVKSSGESTYTDVGNISTNVPNTTSNTCNPLYVLYKTVGTTSSTVNIDYMDYWNDFTTKR